MLTGQAASQRAAALAPDAKAFTLYSRGAGETGYTAYVWQGMEQPAEQEEIILSGATVGERWKVIEMFVQGQTVLPKELDQISDGVNKWTIKTISRRFNGNIYRCRALLAMGA